MPLWSKSDCEALKKYAETHHSAYSPSTVNFWEDFYLCNERAHTRREPASCKLKYLALKGRINSPTSNFALRKKLGPAIKRQRIEDSTSTDEDVIEVDSDIEEVSLKSGETNIRVQSDQQKGVKSDEEKDSKYKQGKGVKSEHEIGVKSEQENDGKSKDKGVKSEQELEVKYEEQVVELVETETKPFVISLKAQEKYFRMYTAVKEQVCSTNTKILPTAKNMDRTVGILYRLMSGEKSTLSTEDMLRFMLKTKRAGTQADLMRLLIFNIYNSYTSVKHVQMIECMENRNPTSGDEIGPVTVTVNSIGRTSYVEREVQVIIGTFDSDVTSDADSKKFMERVFVRASRILDKVGTNGILESPYMCFEIESVTAAGFLCTSCRYVKGEPNLEKNILLILDNAFNNQLDKGDIIGVPEIPVTPYIVLMNPAWKISTITVLKRKKFDVSIMFDEYNRKDLDGVFAVSLDTKELVTRFDIPVEKNNPVTYLNETISSHQKVKLLINFINKTGVEIAIKNIPIPKPSFKSTVKLALKQKECGYYYIEYGIIGKPLLVSFEAHIGETKSQIVLKLKCEKKS